MTIITESNSGKISFSITLGKTSFLFIRTWWPQVIAWPSFTSLEAFTLERDKHWRLETVSSSDLSAPAMFSYHEGAQRSQPEHLPHRGTSENNNKLCFFHDAKHERRWWPPAGKATRRTQSQHVCCNNLGFYISANKGRWWWWWGGSFGYKEWNSHTGSFRRADTQLFLNLSVKLKPEFNTFKPLDASHHMTPYDTHIFSNLVCIIDTKSF